MRKIIFIFLAIGILSISGVCTKYNDEDYAILSEELGGGSGNTDCSVDIVGEWWVSDPNSCGATEDQRINFYCDGTGSVNSPDCNNICVPGLWWDFTYTVSGGVCTLIYADPNPHESCGTNVPPATNASFSYTVSGGVLTTSFGAYHL
jgi:hypothetical protein